MVLHVSLEQRLLDLIADVIGLLDLRELREGLLAALARSIPTDYVSINEIGDAPEDVVAVVRPPLPARFHAAFARHAHENPLVRHYAIARSGRARRFSDVVTREELQATSLYRELYAPLGVEHQVAFTLPAAPGRLVGVALSRGHPDYTDDERALLDRARPYLIQVYRNAAAYTALRAALSKDPTPEETTRALTRAGLTVRQAEVVARVALGDSNRAVGLRLGISERTVQKHLQRAFAVLGVHTRSAAGIRTLELVRASLGDGRAPPLAGE